MWQLFPVDCDEQDGGSLTSLLFWSPAWNFASSDAVALTLKYKEVVREGIILSVFLSISLPSYFRIISMKVTSKCCFGRERELSFKLTGETDSFLMWALPLMQPSWGLCVPLQGQWDVLDSFWFRENLVEYCKIYGSESDIEKWLIFGFEAHVRFLIYMEPQITEGILQARWQLSNLWSSNFVGNNTVHNHVHQ